MRVLRPPSPSFGSAFVAILVVALTTAAAAAQTILRERPVRFVDHLIAAAQRGGRFRIDLFDGRSAEVVFEAAHGPGTWSGRIAGKPGGRFTMVRRGDAVAALLRGPGLGTYQLRTLGGGLHTLLEIDPGAFPPCGNGPAQGVALPDGPAVGAAVGGGCADGSVIDVLILYTPLARDAAGGTAAIEAEIGLAVALSNESYTNSLIGMQINAVQIAEIDYDEGGTFTGHLYSLTSSNDGIMDEAHGMRYNFSADMVALIVADSSLGGVAWLLPENSPAGESLMFSVTNWASAAGGLILAHEMGHNMGCCHAPGDGGGCGVGGLYLYSVGHRFFGDSGTQWRTVMAYSPGVRTPNFSNPAVNIDGQPTGIAFDEPDAADNSLTINQTAATIASFRCGLPYCAVNEVLASDGIQGDALGYAMSRSGDRTLIGAVLDGDTAALAGSAYVFGFDAAAAQWSQHAKLLASDGAAGDLFGYAVAIDGDVAIVGAAADDDNGSNSGSAYVYRYDPASQMWIEEAKLLADDGGPGDSFGAAVAVSGDTAIVGAWLDSVSGAQSGSAYLFRYDADAAAWLQQTKLIPSDGGALHYFGDAVAIAGEYAVVGAPAPLAAGESGAAYVYQFSTATASWAEQAKLAEPTAPPGAGFGDALAIGGDVLVVGASGDDALRDEAGSAYVYRFDGSTWQQEAVLQASDGDVGDRFGGSVAVQGSLITVGADGDNDNGGQSGAAYVYRHDGPGWAEAAKLITPQGLALDFFGSAVATDGIRALVGAFGDDDGGAMFVFDAFTGADCNGNGAEDGCDIASGASSDLNGNGIPDECDTPGDLNGDGVVNVVDLLEFLSLLGSCGDCDNCPGDFDGDCFVGVADLLIMLANWG